MSAQASDTLEAMVVELDGGTAALRGSRCVDCGRTEFPSLAGCPACGAEVREATLGPGATLAGFTEVLHAPPDATVDVPYTIAAAAFAQENLAVLGLLDRHVPVDELQLGLPLEVCVVSTNGAPTYGFRLA